MSDFSVKPDLEREASSLRAAARSLTGYANTVLIVRASLARDSFAGAGVDRSLRSIAQSLNNLSDKTKSLSNTVSQCYEIYFSTERQLASENANRGSNGRGNNDGGTGGDNGFVPNIFAFDFSKLFDLILPNRRIGVIPFIVPVYYLDFDWIKKFINNEYKIDGSVIGDAIKSSGKILGFDSSGEISGGLINGDASISSKANFKFKDKAFGVSTTAKAGFSLAKGTVKGNIGYLYGELNGKAGVAEVSGAGTATLFTDGKFDPSLGFEAKAEGSVLKGDAKVGFGTDQYGAYGKAEGDVLHAEAYAKAGVGSYKDKNGNVQHGAYAKAGALASVAQGKVKGGVTLFGIDIDIGVKGYAGGVGGEIGGGITTEGAKVNLGGALGLGAGAEINVDWSDAKWLGDSAKAVADFTVNSAQAIDQGVREGAKFIGSVANDVKDGISGLFVILK